MKRKSDKNNINEEELIALLEGGVTGEIDSLIVMAKRLQLECKIYDYQGECNVVYKAYKQGYISKKIALRKLDKIEKEAYNKIPQAEPDGDITHCCCSYVSKILKKEEDDNFRKRDMTWEYSVEEKK